MFELGFLLGRIIRPNQVRRGLFAELVFLFNQNLTMRTYLTKLITVKFVRGASAFSILLAQEQDKLLFNAVIFVNMSNANIGL